MIDHEANIQHAIERGRFWLNKHLTPPYDREDEMLHARARREHAWLLRAEGLTYREIGERLGGITPGRASQIVAHFGRTARWRTRHTRFRWVSP